MVSQQETPEEILDSYKTVFSVVNELPCLLNYSQFLPIRNNYETFNTMYSCIEQIHK